MAQHRFEPGNKFGGGRPKGVGNKATNEIKEAYQKLLENNLDNMSTWLAQVASKDPEKAIDLMLKLSEYIVPKLARQELTGSDGKDLFEEIKFTFTTAKEDNNGEGS